MMRRADLVTLALETLTLHRLRTGLTLAAIAIGVTAVLLLTALGDAAKAYVVKEFAGVGTNLVIVTHDPRVAAHARRVLRMQDGKLLEGADGALPVGTAG